MTDELTSSDISMLSLWDKLERLERDITRIGALIDRATDQAPNVVGMAIDVADELAARTTARGIDIDAVLGALLALTARLAALMESPEFGRFVASGALAPGVAEVAARAGDALAETGAEPGGRAGLLALLRASRDPDVQRALDFSLRFMKRFGRALDSAAPAEEDAHD